MENEHGTQGIARFLSKGTEDIIGFNDDNPKHGMQKFSRIESVAFRPWCEYTFFLLYPKGLPDIERIAENNYTITNVLLSNNFEEIFELLGSNIFMSYICEEYKAYRLTFYTITDYNRIVAARSICLNVPYDLFCTWNFYTRHHDY